MSIIDKRRKLNNYIRKYNIGGNLPTDPPTKQPVKYGYQHTYQQPITYNNQQYSGWGRSAVYGDQQKELRNNILDRRGLATNTRGELQGRQTQWMSGILDEMERNPQFYNNDNIRINPQTNAVEAMWDADNKWYNVGEMLPYQQPSNQSQQTAPYNPNFSFDLVGRRFQATLKPNGELFIQGNVVQGNQLDGVRLPPSTLNRLSQITNKAIQTNVTNGNYMQAVQTALSSIGLSGLMQYFKNAGAEANNNNDKGAEDKKFQKEIPIQRNGGLIPTIRQHYWMRTLEE